MFSKVILIHSTFYRRICLLDSSQFLPFSILSFWVAWKYSPYFSTMINSAECAFIADISMLLEPWKYLVVVGVVFAILTLLSAAPFDWGKLELSAVCKSVFSYKVTEACACQLSSIVTDHFIWDAPSSKHFSIYHLHWRW